LFRELIGTIKGTIVEVVFKAEAVRQEQQQGVEQHQSAVTPHGLAAGAEQKESQHRPDNVEEVTSKPNKDIGRNDPCHCGSGKKFKKCHGA
jgi:preprotein translocase subunit SecA